MTLSKIDIKSPSGTTLLSSSVNEGAKGYFNLMQHDYIVLPFKLKTPIDFKIGSYVDLRGVFDEALGGKLAKIYYVTDKQVPTYNISTGAYEYQLRLNAYYWLWNNFIFKYTPESTAGEASWSLTAPLDVQMGVFLRNLKELGFTYNGEDYTVEIDDTVVNKAVAMTYDNIHLLDALFSMGGDEAWDCDVWVTGKVIHFGRLEQGTAVKIELGVEASDMTRSESKGTFATRIYAFGSTRNLPTNYRPTDDSMTVNGVVQKRLMLPEGTPYIDAYTDLDEKEVVEEVVVFDNIYPRRIGTLSNVQTVDRPIENEDGEQTGTFKAYQYKDTGLTFSKSYILPNQELRVVFQSGKLNGLDFGVTFNPNGSNPEEQLWEIVANEDYGRRLPDETIKPENGDTYILYGFDIQLVSDQYIPSAEQELKEATEEYVEKSKIDDGTYTVPLRASWVKSDQINRTFDAGQRIKLVNPSFFPEEGRISRVIGWEMYLDIPYDSPIYTIGESAQYSRIGNIEEKIETIGYKGSTYSGIGGSSVYLVKTNDNTPASNSNAFSALRTIAEINKRAIRKDAEDSTDFLVSFLKGINVGDFSSGESGAKIDENGSGELLNLVLRGVLSTVNYVAGKSGAKIDSTGAAELASLILRAGLKSAGYTSGTLGSGYSLDFTSEGNSRLEIDELFVRKIMEVVRLIISEVKSVGGQIIISGASITCTKVEETDTAYRCYFDNDNGTTAIENQFEVGDQAMRRTFNIKSGVHENVQNEYYWRLVTAVGDNYIDLSKTDCDANSTIPQAGDEIVMVGNRNNAARQGAIILSAYGDDAPYIKMYRGINSYNLSGKEYFEVSRDTVNIVVSNLTFSSGQSIEDYVKDTVDTSVGDIQIGGRNYARNTGNEFKITSVEHDKYVYHDLGYDVLGLKSGDRIIVSFDYEAKDIVFEDDSLIILQFKASYAFRVFLNLKENGTAHVVSEVILLDKNSSWTPIKETDNGSPYGRFDYITINPGGYLRVWNFKVEKGTVATDWSPAPEDVESEIDAAKEAAATAQEAADQAAEDISAVNAEMDKMTSDSYISPTEKTALKQQQSDIQSEYGEITANANRYGVSTTAYQTAYNSANTALTKYTASSPEYITVGSDFANIAAYYTARKTILDAIAAAAKKVADDAATSAAAAIAAAQEAENKAQEAADDASEANTRLNQWAEDSVISPTEKQGLKDEIARIDADKSEIAANYTKYGLGTPTAYNNAYTAYRAVLVTLSASTPEVISIPSDFSTKQSTYYTQRTTALTTIASAAKDYADEVVDNVQVGGRNFAKGTNQGKINWYWSNAVGGATLTEVIEDGIRCCKMVRDDVPNTSWTVIGYTDINRNKLEAGATYTVSFEVYRTVSGRLSCSFRQGNGQNDMVASNKVVNNAYEANKWSKLIYILTLKDPLPGSTGQGLYLYNVDPSVGSTYIFRNLKIEKGNKATDWTPAPEDTDGAIKGVSNDLEAYKTEVDVEFTKTNEAIAQSVTETKEYTDGRISTVNTTLNTQVGRIDAAVTRIDNIDGEITDMETRITQTEKDITATVKVNDLTVAGITLSSSGIVATADKFLIKQTNGQQVALFENGYLNANLIDVDQIFANDITTGNITITNGAKIGDFTVDEGGLITGTAAEGFTLAKDYILITKNSGKKSSGIGDCYNSNLEGVAGWFKVQLSGSNYLIPGEGVVTILASGGSINYTYNTRQIGLSVYTSNGASDYALDLKGRIRIGGQKAFTGTWSITDPWSNIKSITFQDGLVVSCV